MVAYLSKSDASEGFTQIIDFLNGSYIKYALTVNLNIYVSCIKQFWTTVAIKQVNDVTRLQALVDKKKVVVTKATIREALCLDDAEGVDCLPNEEIFAELARMGYEKPSTKLTFYKAFFPSQWKFLIHTILQCMSAKRTSWNEFNDKEEDREVADAVKDVEEAKVDESAQDQGRQAESQAKIYKIDMDHANKVLSMQKDETEPAEVQEVVDVVTTAKLITEVDTATSETITAAIIVAPSRRRKRVVIRDPEGESITSTIIPAETKSKDKGKGILVEEPKPLNKKQQIKQDKQYARELQDELNKNIDWDEAIDHVKRKAKEDPAVKRYQLLKRKPQTEVQARKNMMMYLKNVAGFKMDYFKGMSYDDIRPIFEAKFNSNVAFLLKTKEQIEEDENKALKRLNETPAKKAAKRQKLDEEVEELKRHLQIVPNKDDDVYKEATPLARKVPIVDYQIIEMKNKPYYKIFRADDTHQLYVSFLSLLRNFDREDLEALWSLVKERFSTTKPKNFYDDFLLVTLGAMFEKPDIHAQILEDSEKCTWSSKGQRMEATGIMWCTDHNFYIHPADFVGREEVIDKSFGWLVLNSYNQDTVTSRLSSNWDPWEYRTDLERSKMRGSDINTLTMEQYFKMIDENHAPGMVNEEFRRTIEGDIEDMTIDEYMKYKAKMKRKSWRDSQSYFLTKYDNWDVGSFHLEKNKTSNCPYYTDDAKIDEYYDLPPLLPCFKPIQPYTKHKNESYKEELDEEINYMSH
nr:hypothetical protein [Tanacetum cinerariifolium]